MSSKKTVLSIHRLSDKKIRTHPPDNEFHQQIAVKWVQELPLVLQPFFSTCVYGYEASNSGAVVNPNESIWLQQALHGDDDAFSMLVEQYQNPVFNLCYRMLGDPYQAEDAAQETFWRAYQALKRYDSQRSFATWLLSIAAHFCIDQQRKRHLPTLQIDDYITETAADPAPDPERVYSKMEEQRAIQELLAGLSAQDRAVIVLRYWNDLSEEEISQSLDMTVSAVKSRLHRARLKLAQQAQDTHSSAYRVERKKDESLVF